MDTVTGPGKGVVANVEILKLSFDWCKHIATLSTGSILLMVTFREKLSVQSGQGECKILLLSALGGFMCAIVGTLGVQLEHLKREYYGSPSSLGKVAMFLVVAGFLVGIISLSLFGFQRLL
jgi:hypothetical protein